jgi:predicted DCC family thiol-disulfide oxidoreductase YuxK
MPTAPAHSYRDDPAVPSFPDDRPLIIFDGVCALCSGFVRFVLRHDSSGRFRFASAQSALGTALYRHYGLHPENWESNLLIAEGRLYLRSEAAIEITSRFGGAWGAISFFRMVPRSWRDRFYDLIARNRYRWFGQHDYCAVPDPALADRFLAQ